MSYTKMISLSMIVDVYLDDLSQSRLRTLENGHSPFNDVLNSSSDPITLEWQGGKYGIIDGRHRIYLARQKGYSEVPAQVR